MKFATVAAIAFGAVSCYAGGGVIGNQCNIGTTQCCNELQGYNELHPDIFKSVTNFFGGSLEKVIHGQFGITCTPVSVAGGTGNQCNQQTVCCQDLHSAEGIGANCSPINING